MKFSLSWLKRHLDTTASLDEIVETMIAVGLEVEEVEDPRERLAAFTIGEVLEAEPHPDADKLRVCKVATKDGEMQIVCGAPNARAGIKVAYAPVGAYVPGIDVTLSKAKIRGVESHGMMCSSRELELGDDHDGIIEAPLDAAVGASVAEVLGHTDPVIDFEVTPNRPDTNGVDGVARDLAAAGLGELITPAVEPVSGEFPCPQTVELDFPDDAKDACPLFTGRLIRGVKNGPSPEWLQKALLSIGLRPINALVDVTNFVTYDRGRPLHVYDASKLEGPIRARLGTEGGTLEALDDKTYAFDETMCVIADDARVLGLGGIIGGTYSGSEDDTTDVFVECAYFDPLRTAKTGRKAGVVSDARYRFERGVDPNFVIPGIEMATRLILEVCGGEPSEVFVAGAVPPFDKVVDFPPAEVKRLTGVEVSEDEIDRILTALGFGVERGVRWSVSVPSWRPDVEGKADLVEEVARIKGFDAMEAVSLPPLEAVATPKYTLAQDRARLARRALAARGLHEAVTWSFCDMPDAVLFAGSEASLAARGQVLANPISSDLGVMRPSLLPGLISALQRNADRGRPDVALFEVGPEYANDSPTGQQTVAAGARRSRPARHWAGADPAADVFAVKADALAVLEAAGFATGNVQITSDAAAYYHPGRSGVIRLGPKLELAHFGELHPRVLKAMDVDGPILAFEVFLKAVPEPKAKATKTKPALDASSLLPLRRDFAFVVAEDVAAETLLKAVRGAEKQLIAGVSLFDVYQGKGVPEGKKSLAVEVTLQPRDKTLTDEEIEKVSERIVAQAAKATGAELRG